jgi:pimeloyl-ACP methyl ester carboxylesterase
MPQSKPVDAGSACLILSHGAGSTGEFLSRAFPSRACGLATYYLDDRTGSVLAIAEQLAASAARHRRRHRRVLIGGVSIGAHAAALAATGPAAGVIDGLVLALPAWTGPAPAGSPTRAAAAEVAASGCDAVLDRLCDDPRFATDWVVAELRRAWPGRSGLAAELAVAADAAAPAVADLRAIDAPALVIALSGDPFHPVGVARAWASAIPRAELVHVERQAPSTDRAVFGRAVGSWLADSALSAPR